MFDFSGRVALVTGAAGNLGRAVAQRLHEAGARTILADRNGEALGSLFGEPGSGHMVRGGLDLTDEAAVAGLVRDALQQFGGLDLLVNTVGGFRGGPLLHDTDLADWDVLLSVNLRTTLLTCRAVMPHFLARSSGSIVNVGARPALAGMAGLAAYSAAKAGVLRLTESLAQEVKDAGIRVNCVLPAMIDTPDNRAAMPDADTGTWVPPEAIADVILFLCSDAARAVTGAAIPVYGTG